MSRDNTENTTGVSFDMGIETVEVIASVPSLATGPAFGARSSSYTGSSSSSHRHGNRHRRLSHASGSDRSTRSVEEYVLPPEAPMVRVPDNIPVSDTVLLDLVASAVAKGGPSVEEELAKREANNPRFSFLQASWNDPHMLYYRWRLYSLLQGDTLTSWRTAPFQMERGPQAVVWVPPPALNLDADSLRPAIDAAVGAPPPAVPSSAVWLSRKMAEEKHLFAVLEDEAAAQWTELLRQPADHRPSYSPQCRPGAPQPSSAEIEARWREWFGEWRDRLFTPQCIATCMVFAVEHSTAPHHILSLLVDEFVGVAYESTYRTYGVTRAECVFTPLSQIEEECAAMTSECLHALWLLFVLHDTFSNVSEIPLSDSDIEQLTEESPPGRGSAESAALSLTASLSALDKHVSAEDAGRRKRTWLGWSSAAEAILPTIIESVALVALNAIHLSVGLATEVSSSGLAAALGRGVLSKDHRDDRRVKVSYTTEQSSSAGVKWLLPATGGERDIADTLKQQAANFASLLLSWLRTVFQLWEKPIGGRTVLHNRYAAKLADRYPFLQTD